MHYANSFENYAVNRDVYNGISIPLYLKVSKAFSLLPTIEYIYD